jgi:hypothetical protein
LTSLKDAGVIEYAVFGVAMTRYNLNTPSVYDGWIDFGFYD